MAHEALGSDDVLEVQDPTGGGVHAVDSTLAHGEASGDDEEIVIADDLAEEVASDPKVPVDEEHTDAGAPAFQRRNSEIIEE